MGLRRTAVISILSLSLMVSSSWTAQAQAPELERAKELHMLAQAKFETFDFPAAIELWTQAYAKVPSGEEYASIKTAVVFNLASAHREQYKVDGEKGHLEKAIRLLERWAAEEGDSLDPESRRANEAEVARLKAQLEAAEGGEKPTQSESEQAPPKDEAPKDAAEPAAPASVAEEKPGRPLVIGGAVAGALGLGGFGLMTVGLLGAKAAQAEGDDLNTPYDDLAAIADRGRRGNTLGIIGASAGTVLLGAGAALIVLGVKKNKASGTTLSRVVPRASFGVDHGELGLTFHGSF